MTTLTSSDHIAITQLIGTIMYAVDAHEPERWLACWSRQPRMVVEAVGRPTREVTGRDELRATTAAWSTRDPSQVHHVGVVTVIDDGEDWAKTTHSAELIRMSDAAPRLAAFAHYHDHLVREGGEWRVHDRHVRIWFAQTDQ